jgi:hypothetical protein
MREELESLARERFQWQDERAARDDRNGSSQSPQREYP